MSILNRQLYSICIIIISLDVPSTWAQDVAEKSSGTQFNAELSVGGEYDSNVAVDEFDLSSSQSDYALTMSAKLESHSALSSNTELDLSYNFSQSLYKEFSIVDRQTHILGSNLDLDMGKFDGGLSFFYIHSRLDGKKFLKFYRVSPSVSGFISKKWFTRGAYVYSDKTIARSSQRDAISNIGEFDIYYFHRGLRSYFNLGYQYKYEDANAEEYDYRSGGLKLRYIRRFDLFQKIATLELGFRYEDRSYTSPTPSIQEKRSDQRQRWRIDLEIPVIEGGAIKFYATYGDFQSNLPRADYEQNLIGTRFIYAW